MTSTKDTEAVLTRLNLVLKGIQTVTNLTPLISWLPEIELTSTLGRAIHAQCFQWFANADAALAQYLHQQETVPFTLGV